MINSKLKGKTVCYF